MARLFVNLDADSPEFRLPTKLYLQSESTHYLIHVLRLEVGDYVELIDRQSARAFDARILNLGPRLEAELYAEVQWRDRANSRVSSLLVGLPKGKRADLIVEKATELGVAKISFWQAQHSVPILRDGQEQAKVDRWKRVAEAAAKQCQRQTIPNISFFNSLESLLTSLQSASGNAAKLLCCSLSEDALPLRQLLPPKHEVHLVIGPEGDFSESELNQLRNSAFEFINLGSTTLRVETAAIAAVAQVDALWGY